MSLLRACWATVIRLDHRLCLTLPAVVVVLLPGCGGGSSATKATSSAIPSSPAAAVTPASAANIDAVASVAGVPITKSSYEHWLAVEKAGGASTNASHRALSFLITSQWVIGEAAARKLSVSDSEVKQRFDQASKQGFPKAGTLGKFLAKAQETEADLLARVKVELLQSRLAANVSAHESGSQRTAFLASFQESFQRHWKAHTTCKPAYVMEDCSEYKGTPENLAAPSALPRRGSPSSSPTASTGTPAYRHHGRTAFKYSSISPSSASPTVPAGTTSPYEAKVYTPPNTLTLSSSAFAINGGLPVHYTCDGANISPPLAWKNLPANTAALALFVFDKTAKDPSGPVVWAVGDINPATAGVAAGHTPKGGIVGANASGNSNYGGVCPPHGKTSTIEFVLYALSKKIPLTPGFQPTDAQHEYESGNLILGSAAVDYAIYHRA